MSRANSSTTPEKKQNNNKDVQRYALRKLENRFDSKLMAAHSYELGCAGDTLGHAFDACTAIGGLASMLRSSGVANDLNRGGGLDPSDEFHILAAIELIAQGLELVLDQRADWFRMRLTEGGA